MKLKNIISAFDGISAAQVALRRSGIKYTRYYSFEIDEKAIAVTQKRFPKTIQLGNIQQFDFNLLPDADLLIGGSPCQSFSNCGLREGFNGASSLFWEYIKLLRCLRPKYFILENVKMKKEWQQIITDTIGVNPIEINSSLVSGQGRKRLYWTNIKGVVLPADRGITLSSVIRKNKGDYVDREKSYCCSANYRPSHIDQYRVKFHKQVVLNDTLEKGFRKLTPEEYEKLQTFPVGYTRVAGNSMFQRYKQLGNSFTVDVISHILSFIKKVDDKQCATQCFFDF